MKKTDCEDVHFASTHSQSHQLLLVHRLGTRLSRLELHDDMIIMTKLPGHAHQLLFPSSFLRFLLLLLQLHGLLSASFCCLSGTAAALEVPIWICYL